MRTLWCFACYVMLLTTVVCASVSARGWELVTAVTVVVACALSSRWGSRTRADENFALVLGLAIPTLAWSASRVILIVSLGFFLLRWSRARLACQSRIFVWAAPLLLYLFGNLVGEVVVAFDLLGGARAGVLRGILVDGWMRAVDLVRALCDVHAPSWKLLARVLLLAGIVEFFTPQESPRRAFMKGLIIGSCVSAAFAIGQWLGWIPLQLSNQTPFWNSLGRVAGLLSDPNALGVVMVLSLWIAALMQREDTSPKGWRLLCWTALVVAAGVVSGSRTFLLGAVLLCAAISWRRSKKLLVVVALGLTATVSVVTVLDSWAGLAVILDAQSWLPQGVIRGISALSLSRLSDTFGSRTLFVELASAVGSGHWVFGLGADRFREYVPLVGVQSGLIHKWTDNANSLYLALLVELGIVGCLCVCAVALARSVKANPPARLGVWVCIALALMMGTGPHTDFIEVVVLVGFVVAVVSQPRAEISPGFFLVSIATGLLGVAASFVREQGAYTWWEQRGNAVRWLAHRAHIELVCKQDKETPANGSGASHSARTLLEPMYIPQREPLKVVVTTGEGFRSVLEFETKVRRELRLPCARLGERLLVTVVTEPPWSPYRAWPRISGDRRILGVQQIENGAPAHHLASVSQ